MTTLDTKQSSSTDCPCRECSPFLNWNEEDIETEDKQAVVFRSLVATVKSQPALDASLEAKAVKFLESVAHVNRRSADDFLNNFVLFPGDSLTVFVQSIVVLISSASQVIATATMEMLEHLISSCSVKVCLALVKADMIPQLIISLNLQSLSVAEAVDIHTCLLSTIQYSFWLTTLGALALLGIEDRKEQLAVNKTIFQQILTPSEKYICHLCASRYSIVHGDFLTRFLLLLAQILRISPSHQPTMDFVLHLPVVLTIPSCLIFIENDRTIWTFLYEMIDTQQRWNKQGGEVRQMWKTVNRMLRMEGIEDVIEKKLQNDKTEDEGGTIVVRSIKWNNLLGMNIQKQKWEEMLENLERTRALI
ncbi:hypothetical protein BLNAU_13479 [Blattamonas nauphoetae]|uniref:Uncharacterized protein n=1 Tax=Blattamonas nauphoetae TaxID=2049346 RepID=A0ABQ9XN84_9EUKA|nr:hypothetical protein BLNAU_13479 [Blattamonas nauphoetae]